MSTSIQTRYRVDLYPRDTLRDVRCSRKKSTLQRATFGWTRGCSQYGDTWYLVVRAEKKWNEPDFDRQDFAVAVAVEANLPQLYNLVSQRVRARVRARARG